MTKISEKIVQEDIENIISDIKDFCTILSNKHFLITGGKGFIGTYFCKTLLELNKFLVKPIKIIVMDNLITAKEKKYRNDNIIFHKTDISKNFNVKHKIDYIIHTASIASPPVYRKFPLRTIDVNYQGTRNILEFAKKNKVSGILYISSSEVYGNPDLIPTPESYYGYVSSVGPRACYDESKRLAETLCTVYFQQFNIPVKIARPFNVYGPFLNLNDGRVIPDFMKNAIKNSEIIIYSDGTPTRSFCYVTDAIRAFFRILLLAPPGSIFNVGNDEEISMKEIAKKIKKISNKSISLKFKKNKDHNYTVDNPQRRCPDLTKIIKAVHYYPQVKLDDGLKRIYKWYVADIK